MERVERVAEHLLVEHCLADRVEASLADLHVGKKRESLGHVGMAPASYGCFHIDGVRTSLSV